MCIVTDYIGKYPLRTKQILGISYNQLRTLIASSIFRHRELENLKENQKIRINAAGGGRPHYAISPLTLLQTSKLFQCLYCIFLIISILDISKNYPNSFATSLQAV